MIQFRELGHKYFTEKRSDFTSLTSVIESYHEKFEDSKDFWLTYKAVQYLTEGIVNITSYDKNLHTLILATNFKMNKRLYSFTSFEGKHILKTLIRSKDVLADEYVHLQLTNNKNIIDATHTIISTFWDSGTKTAQEDGTAFHLEQETIETDLFNGKFYHLDEWIWMGEKFNFKKGMMYNEVRLCSEEHGIAGTTDRVHAVTDNSIFIRDWKTNKKIRRTAYKNQKMFYPLNEIEDCEYGKYKIQLSGYAYMLERIGYTIEGLQFEHFARKSGGGYESTPTIYECPYERDTVIALFEDFKLKNSF